MTTPAIENVIQAYPNVEITIFGSSIATTVFKHHPNIERVVIDHSRQSSNRILSLYKIAKALGKFDIALSFRRVFFSKLFIFFSQAQHKGNYQRYSKQSLHQVIRYNNFINRVFDLNTLPQKLKIYLQQQIKPKNVLGINPGATYGSAKRWYPERFAEVINQVASQFDQVIIFGGDNEIDIAQDIVNHLTIHNYQNLAGKLSIDELFIRIANLNTFLTADSGPMHIAAAFSIQTIALFGPTKDVETAQWQNPNSQIIKKEFSCMPCMQRKCPLKGALNHQCMKAITSDEMINIVATHSLNQSLNLD